MKNSFLGVIKSGDILYLNDGEYLEFLKANEGREVMVTIQPIELPFTEPNVEN